MSEKNNFVKIGWYGKHFGEEPPLTLDRGAGGIFFSGCNMRCVFCQNYQISQDIIGKNYSIDELSKIMIDLQDTGALNIDLVSPTIWYKQIKESILIAKENGLHIPIIWNSNGYENINIIKELSGLIDIYLPDFKYADNDVALKYSKIKNYEEIAIEAIKEMYNQVGLLKIKNDTAISGIIIRHLILPNNIKNSFLVLDEISKINKNIHVSLMSQYNPLYKASDFPEINRKINQEEFDKVYNYQLDIGIENGWHQELDSSDNFVPDFKKEKPFD